MNRGSEVMKKILFALVATVGLANAEAILANLPSSTEAISS